MTTASQLTYSGVLLSVFANQICLPVPSIVFLMAAGALSAHGRMRVSIIVCLSVLACLVADGIWFWFGRRWGSQALRVVCRFTNDPRRCSKNAHDKFRRHGLGILCVAKFFPGLDGVLPPLVGGEGVSIRAFLAFDGLGSLLWSAFYVGLGYLMADQLDIAIAWASHFGTALGIAIGLPIALYAGWRGLTLIQTIRRLRLRRISPAMLHCKLKSGRKVAVLDLLDFEEENETESLAAIPGAMRIEASRIRTSPQVAVPDDIDVILCSSTGRDLVSARAALALNHIGVHKVWVLEGGLKAWREQGFPVSRSLEAPEVIAERLGIKLPKPQLA